MKSGAEKKKVLKKRTELDRYVGGDQLDQHAHYRLLEYWEQNSGRMYIWKTNGQAVSQTDKKNECIHSGSYEL